MTWRKRTATFHRLRRNVAGAILLLAGCGLPAPTARDFDLVRQIPPPPGPYVRATAVADIDGDRLAGTFDVLLLARTGPRPLVRLQLLPDLGGKALDLVASPDHLRGRLPHTGEDIDWALPDDARAHPLLFMALSLLERLAPITEDRVIGAGHSSPYVHVFELQPVVEGCSVRVIRNVEPGARGGWGFHLRWGSWVSWTLDDQGVSAPGFRLRLRNLKIETLASIDEGLLRLK
jgi:hypothetical protein